MKLVGWSYVGFGLFVLRLVVSVLLCEVVVSVLVRVICVVCWLVLCKVLSIELCLIWFVCVTRSRLGCLV